VPAYRCPRCGTTVEGDPATLRCPACGYPEAARPAPQPAAPWPTLPPIAPQAVVPARPVQPLSGLGEALTVLLVVASVAGVLTLLFPFPSGGRVADSPVQALLGLLAAASIVATVITFCVWLHRACANAAQAQPAAGVRPGWAVGSFFVPVVHFWIPFQQVRKAWRAHGPPQAAGLLSGWFAAWCFRLACDYLAGAISARISLRIALEAARTHQDPASIHVPPSPLADALGVVGALAGVAAAILLIRVVRRWSAWQDAHPPSPTVPPPPALLPGTPP
jgi:hypothetical protein